MRVQAQYLNHTAPTLGYRLEIGGVSVVYATDHEPFWWSPSSRDAMPDVQHPGDRRHLEFLKGADLVIHDAQFSDSEYGQRRGWGHSTIEYVVDMAALAGAKRLVLYHHDPDRTDAAVSPLTKACSEEQLLVREAAVRALDWISANPAAKDALESAAEKLASQLAAEQGKVQYLKVNEDLRRLQVKLVRL